MDGGWGLHIEGCSTMLCTALNYITLRLLLIRGGGGGDDQIRDEAAATGGINGGSSLEKGRRWIIDHGGVTYIPSWGKFWLSVPFISFSTNNLSLFSWQKLYKIKL